MSTPEEKRKLIEEQVIAKVQWGSGDEDVLEWLGSKHGILDEEAEKLLVRAKRTRIRALREKAVKVVTLASIGLVAAVSYIGVTPWTWGLDRRSLLLIVALASLPFLVTALIRNVLLIVNDDKGGPV